jgi:hypothetical protein
MSRTPTHTPKPANQKKRNVAEASSSVVAFEEIDGEEIDLDGLKKVLFFMDLTFDIQERKCTNSKGEAYDIRILNWKGVNTNGDLVVWCAFGAKNISFFEAYAKYVFYLYCRLYSSFVFCLD